MKILTLISLFLFSLSFSTFAADDASNKKQFEKECAAMIAPGGPCADVKAGGGEEEDA